MRHVPPIFPAACSSAPCSMSYCAHRSSTCNDEANCPGEWLSANKTIVPTSNCSSSSTSSSAQQTGVFARCSTWAALSFAPTLIKYAHPSSQPRYPFVVRPGQLDVALGVDHRGVAKPFLQYWDRDPSQDAVASVGVPEGVRVGPGRRC